MVAASAWSSVQAGQSFPGLLHEHPSIQYATRPTSDRVARLNRALADGTKSLARDPKTRYLRPVLDALGVSPESQLLVFSKTGVQRDYTSPQNPRAIYFDEGVVVAYVPGAPVLEIATDDREQGVVFYTLDQSYPCSYMVYAEAFDGLLPEVRSAVYRRMFEILSGKETNARYAHLSADDRRAIIEILGDTKTDLPAEFRAAF